jgi:MoxR-like ATPase
VVVERALTKTQPIQAIIDPAKLIELQRQVDTVYVDPSLIEYAVRLTTATRQPALVGLSKLERYITFGGSPRASINMVLAARALAFIRGREYALPHDLLDLSLDVLRHRLVLSYEALADEVTPDAILTEILHRLPAPEYVPQGR